MRTKNENQLALQIYGTTIDDLYEHEQQVIYDYISDPISHHLPSQQPIQIRPKVEITATYNQLNYRKLNIEHQTIWLNHRWQYWTHVAYYSTYIEFRSLRLLKVYIKSTKHEW